MLYYANLLGGLLTSEFPYLVLLFSGYLFSRLGLLQKDGIVALSKLVVEIFLPIYLFIQIARSNHIDTLTANSLIIISNLVMLCIAGAIGFIYAFMTKMDIRYRFTWIVILCFNDIRRVHTLMVNTFCYHLTEKSTSEQAFCANTLQNSFVQLFYQEIIMWYVGFNLIRLDRKCTKKITQVAKQISESRYYTNIGKKEDAHDIKETQEKFSIEMADLNERRVTREIYNHVEDAFNKITKDVIKKPIWKEALYIAMRAPLIGMFFGFVVGFITVIRVGIFDTTNIIYVYNILFTIAILQYF
jgi:predicted permease